MTLDNVRQPKPVQITVSGEKIDVENYLRIIKQAIESRGYDNVLTNAGEATFTVYGTIYPGAVNE